MTKSHDAPGGVDVRVKGKNITVTPALHDLVVRKMSRLDKYLDRLQVIDVEVGTEQTRDSAQHCQVEARTRIRGRVLRAVTQNSEMQAALDEAVDKLYRQLNRQKERMKAHHGAKLAEAPAAAEDVLEVEPAPDDDIPRLHMEEVLVEPLFEEEALDAFIENGLDCLVFLNPSNERLNVLYRRGNGDYALIEPRTR